SDGYQEASCIWNGMVARTPALIARCADVADLQAAIRSAASLDVLTAVRCGGHSLAGFGTCDGGMASDLSRMRQVIVDGSARRARGAGWRRKGRPGGWLPRRVCFPTRGPGA